jgi:hypothetical protein
MSPGCCWRPAWRSARAAATSASSMPRCRNIAGVRAGACRRCEQACRELLDALE